MSLTLEQLEKIGATLQAAIVGWEERGYDVWVNETFDKKKINGLHVCNETTDMYLQGNGVVFMYKPFNLKESSRVRDGIAPVIEIANEWLRIAEDPKAVDNTNRLLDAVSEIRHAPLRYQMATSSSIDAFCDAVDNLTNGR